MNSHSFLFDKEVGLWLIARPSIYSFRITHSTFTSTLHFCLGLIQPLAFSLLTCECGHKLDAFNTHLTCCLFGGQWIATHDAIWNIMYALAQKSGHVIWKEWWYALTLGLSLWADFYMTRKDQVLIADVVVVNPMWEMVALGVITRPTCVAIQLNTLLRSTNIKGFMRGTILFQWPWRCTMHPNVILIVSLGSLSIFSTIHNQKVIYPYLFAFKFSSNMLVLPFNVL